MNRRLTSPTILHHPNHRSRSCILWLINPPAPLRTGRCFSSTRSQDDNIINHYEVLKVSPTCSQADLKKQFYTLSRATHPDINKSDPEASSRFSQISESYSTLADPERRKRYDRDVFRVHIAPPQPSSSSSHSNGGGNGGSYAGSRPATGLSKRRGTFRGPPPSFYAHGGGGSGGHRSRDPSHSNNNATGGHTSQNTGTGTGAGAEPDFDPNPISRTQTQEDIRRQSRREAAHSAAQQQVDDDEGFWFRFVVVSGLLIGGLSVGGVFLGIDGGGVGSGGLVRADGSRRDRDRAQKT